LALVIKQAQLLIAAKARIVLAIVLSNGCHAVHHAAALDNLIKVSAEGCCKIISAAITWPISCTLAKKWQFALLSGAREQLFIASESW
jgi:hypothetical protein